MKKANYFLSIIFLLAVNLTLAQQKKESKFNIIAIGGIGYGTVENDTEPNYNMNTNNGEILLNYRINKNFGIATGFGLNELSGNGFNAMGTFYHERTLIKIPLLFTIDSELTNKFRMIGHFGFNTQNIIKDEYRFLSNTENDFYTGWNFGIQVGVGFVFEVSENLNAGINFSGHSDISKFSSNSQSLNDKQKVSEMSSIGFVLMFKL